MQDQIKILTGAQRVRLRPAVIFGDEGLEGAMCALEMLLCVMASECHHRFSSRLVLTLCLDGSMELRDNGRGLYLGSGKAQEDALWKSKLCELYCGSAYPDETHRSYEYSYFEESGQIPCREYESEPYDEMDLCAVQYACEFMDVTVFRGGLQLDLHFEKGENVGGISTKSSSEPSGTVIRFRLDKDVFTCIDIPEEFLVAQLRKLAVLNPNCSVLYRKETAHGIQSEEFRFPKGIASELEAKGAETLSTGVYTAEIKATGKDRYNRPRYGAKIQLALRFISDGGSTEAFHNVRSLPRGGKHIETLLAQISEHLQWQLDCKIPLHILERHLCLSVNTTTTKYASAWGNGTRTWITNTMICDMAEDCIRDDFSHYLKENLTQIRKIFQIAPEQE